MLDESHLDRALLDVSSGYAAAKPEEKYSPDPGAVLPSRGLPARLPAPEKRQHHTLAEVAKSISLLILSPLICQQRATGDSSTYVIIVGLCRRESDYGLLRRGAGVDYGRK